MALATIWRAILPGLAFYFLSIFLRFILLALGLLGVAIYWKSLSEIIWPPQIYNLEVFGETKNLPASVSTIRMGIGTVYGILLLASAAAACTGAWLIYKRLRGGLPSAQFRIPESGPQRFMTGTLYGFFGLFFAYLSIAFVLNFVKIFYTATYAQEAYAIVTSQGAAKNPATGFAGTKISFEFKLPDNQTVTAQSFVSLSQRSKMNVGDTFRVLYWPDRPQSAKPEYNYKVRNLGFPFLKTILFMVLALVGGSGFWECIKPDRKSRPKASTQPIKNHAPKPGQKGPARFGKRPQSATNDYRAR